MFGVDDEDGADAPPWDAESLLEVGGGGLSGWLMGPAVVGAIQDAAEGPGSPAIGGDICDAWAGVEPAAVADVCEICPAVGGILDIAPAAICCLTNWWTSQQVMPALCQTYHRPSFVSGMATQASGTFVGHGGMVAWGAAVCAANAWACCCWSCI